MQWKKMIKKSKDIPREYLLELIAEEKDQYNSYLQLCRYYQINPDRLATASFQARINLLEKVLGMRTSTIEEILNAKS